MDGDHSKYEFNMDIWYNKMMLLVCGMILIVLWIRNLKWIYNFFVIITMTIDLLYSLSTSLLITFVLVSYMYYLWSMSNGTNYQDMHPAMAVVQIVIRKSTYYILNLIPQATKIFGDIFDIAIAK